MGKNTGDKVAGATSPKIACPTSLLLAGPIMEQIGFEIQGAQFDLLDRKFEPERLRILLLLPAAAHGVDIELCGFVEAGLGGLEPGLQ